jgi:hypothetical protein
MIEALATKMKSHSEVILSVVAYSLCSGTLVLLNKVRPLLYLRFFFLWRRCREVAR